MSGSLAERLRSTDPEVRAAACHAVPTDPTGALYLELVGEALGDPDLRVGRAAARALVEANRQGQGDGVPPLIRAALRGPRGSGGRVMAALALAQVETPSPELLPALVEGLGHEDGALRWEAARTLVDVGRLHAETVTLLVGLVAGGSPAPAPPRPSRGDDPGLVRAALTAMAGLFSPPATVLARLEEAARGADPAARQLAERALAQYRADADPGSG